MLRLLQTNDLIMIMFDIFFNPQSPKYVYMYVLALDDLSIFTKDSNLIFFLFHKQIRNGLMWFQENQNTKKILL